MINKFLFSFFIINILLFNSIYCQVRDTSSIVNPLNSFKGLSGIFGEIRTDHFHSGVDFRTNNGLGMQVFASFDGYVSRIKVSTVGFGKALYIDHPNGLTSVYAHLDRYSPKIDSIVKEQQYLLKSYEVEIFPERDILRIKKGELVAFTGNSGTSAGPHLHYELRYSDTQKPFNPLANLIFIKDNLAPRFNSIFIYKMDSLNQLKNYITPVGKYQYSVKLANDTIKGFGKIALGIDATDNVDSLSSVFNISNVCLFLNQKLVYQLELNAFSFAETRFVNSTIDYRAKVEDKKEIIRLFTDPNNLFSCIKNVSNNGLVDIKQDSIYRFDITISDFNKNKSTTTFWIKGVKPADSIKREILSDERVLDYRIDQNIDNKQFKLSIPKNTLYNFAPFYYKLLKTELTKYSPLIKLGFRSVPLNNRVDLRISAAKIPHHLKSKAAIASINGKVTTYPTTWENGLLKASIPSFGDYFVVIDTIPPTVKPSNFSPGKNLSTMETIKFYAKDDLSGIKTVNGYIDGKWALFEYDPKENEVRYTFDPQKLTSNSNHKLEIRIKDERGNERIYNYSFFW